MPKRLCLISFFILFFSHSMLAQELTPEKKRKAYKPDLPGFFLIDIGMNVGLGSPVNFSQGRWGSRTLNLYYHYPIHILNSKFTFNPGGGFSFERFKLVNNYTLGTVPSTDGSYSLIAPVDFQSTWSIRKSMLVNNYFDLMPLEFRFDTNPKDVTRGFNVAVGGRVGFLIESHTKIKYSANGVNITYKDKQPHGVNPIRYSVYMRVGIGNFNLFTFYNISPLFASGKGPAQTSMNTLTFGISLNGL